MKSRKLTALLTALVMLIGTMAFAADNTETADENNVTVYPLQSETPSWLVWDVSSGNKAEISGTEYTKNDRTNTINGDSCTLTSTGDNTIVEMRIGSDAILRSGTEYTVSVDYTSNISNVYSTSSPNGAYMYVINTAPRYITQVTGENSGTFSHNFVPSENITVKDAIKLYIRRAEGTITYSNVKITAKKSTMPVYNTIYPSGEESWCVQSVDDGNSVTVGEEAVAKGQSHSGNECNLTATAGIIEVRPGGNETLSAGTKYTLSFDYDININEIVETNTVQGVYMYIVNDKNKSEIRKNVGARKGRFEKEFTLDADGTVKDTIKLFLRRANGTATFSNFKITQLVEPVLNVAFDGGTAVNYTSYADAIKDLSAAKGKTAVMTLLQDIDLADAGGNTSRLFISNNAVTSLTLNGNNHKIQNCKDSVLFETSSGGELTLNNITIDGHAGSDGAVSIKAYSKGVNLSNVTFANNKNGGIYLQNTITPTVDNSTTIDSLRIRDVALTEMIKSLPAVIVKKAEGANDLSTSVVAKLIGADAYEMCVEGGNIAIREKTAEPTATPEVTEEPSEPTATPEVTEEPSKPTATPEAPQPILTLSVDNAETVNYTSYAYAIKDLSVAKGKTAVMTLLQDIDLADAEGNTSRLFISKDSVTALTVNGNNHKIQNCKDSVLFETSNSGELTLNDITIDSHTGNDGAISIKAYSKAVNMNNVKLTNNKHGIYLQSTIAPTVDNSTTIDSVRIRDVALNDMIKSLPAVIVKKADGANDLSTSVVAKLIGADAYEMCVEGGNIAIREKSKPAPSPTATPVPDKEIATETISDDYEVENMTISKEGEVKIKVKNKNNDKATVTLYAVEYNQDGSLKAVKTVEENIEKGWKKPISMTAPEASVFMLWSGDLMPIINKIEVNEADEQL